MILQIEPIELPHRLDRFNYLEFLEHDLQREIDRLNLPDNIRDNIVYMHDGAPAHDAIIVRDYLNRTFHEWMCTNGPKRWPARTPDLNPLDCFLWGYIKNIVYVQSVEDRLETWRLVQDAFRTVTPQMLRSATETSMRRRLQFCRQAEGQHFEQYPHHHNMEE